jgi:hypothetical protein
VVAVFQRPTGPKGLVLYTTLASVGVSITVPAVGSAADVGAAGESLSVFGAAGSAQLVAARAANTIMMPVRSRVGRRTYESA